MCGEYKTFGVMNGEDPCLLLEARKRVVAIRELEPSFNENGLGPDQSADRNKKRIEERKEKRKLRRERSSARRDLRMDSSFRNQEKRRLKDISDDRKDRKQKEELKFLQRLAEDSNLLRTDGRRKKRKKPRLGH